MLVAFIEILAADATVVTGKVCLVPRTWAADVSSRVRAIVRIGDVGPQSLQSQVPGLTHQSLRRTLL